MKPRKHPLSLTLSALVLSTCILGLMTQTETQNPFRRDDVATGEKLIGLSFSEAKRDSMLDGLKEQLDTYTALRRVALPNSVLPALVFDPLPPGSATREGRGVFRPTPVRDIQRPAAIEGLALASVTELAHLLRAQKVSSEELTVMYLQRLKKYGPKLQCVVTLTEDVALAQARKADREIAAGRYKGPLHGIPYGAKDLLATKSARTTWGSVPFKEQMIDMDATVIRRLENAGAVLLAKLSLGELAWGDVWFGGVTKNPWNYKQGSSGSSAGSAAATAAGLVGFAVGSETYGSIVSPSIRCGTTGLRPTFGRVSRTGAMALSWSMDKIGPICRTVEDCALVLNAICGPDGKDPTVRDVPFDYDARVDLRKLRIGYLKAEFDSVRDDHANNDSSLAALRKLGAELIPVSLPTYPVNDLGIILSAEAAAAFDELTRSGNDDMLVRQIKNAWPNVFRVSRFIPAVEYIQANRIRSLLVRDMAELMKDIDVFVAPPFGGDNLLLTNLTGHPCVVLPNGFSKEGTPTGIVFVGRLYDEGKLLAVAKRFQDETKHHLRHPVLEE